MRTPPIPRKSRRTQWGALMLITAASTLAAGIQSLPITVKPFGKLQDGTPAHLYTLQNAAGFRADITDFGGTVVNLFVPDKHGALADVSLGFESVEDYPTKSAYFGATIGRYGNRIGANGFMLDGKTYTPPLNSGPPEARCTLHGGTVGFDKVMWRARPVFIDGDPALVLEYTSPDGDQGFPGTLSVEVTYRVTANNELRINYRATTDKPTPVNLTNHTYFNLKGEGAGTVLDHVLTIRASKITPVDPHLIPTGEYLSVAGTPFDFNTPHAVGARIGDDHEQIKFGGGYDHNWVLEKPDGELALIATLHEPRSGRFMEVLTTEPGMQFYSGNFLNGTKGKSGHTYDKRGGLCLETQHYPDSPNRPEFPSTILRPGETYASTTIYRFGVR
ncbi:MAG TPA: aldose epimerase family protein [Opitutaceae bacterium]|nr:aldose epimerase family protein [Opitutaceae bacterium]